MEIIFTPDEQFNPDEQYNQLMHTCVCSELYDTFCKKNKDYGDSFRNTFNEFGIVSAVIRMKDKVNRLKTLAINSECAVEDESIRDTLMDLANYAIMTVIELDRIQEQEKDEEQGEWDGN